MADRDDETWVAELSGQRGKQRQEQAFQDLGNILLPLVRWRLSNYATRPPGWDRCSYHDLDHLAQDIVQDSLVCIWQKGLKIYRREARFLTFAKAIAINQTWQALRQIRRRKEQAYALSDDDGVDEGNDEGLPITARSKMVMAELSPEKQVMLREVVHRLDRILTGECSAREREAFVKKYLDDLTSSEIAQLMGTTERAVNLLTFNARHKIKQALEEDGYTLSVLLAILDL